jgi:hypothetical protein
MRLPDVEHTSRPWRIHELTRDFRVEDVWALPVAGGRDDFPRLVAQLAAADPARGSSRLARMLWRIRGRIGRALGWDRPAAGLGSRVRTLRERLPPDLRSAPGPEFAALPFAPLYLLGDEFAAEIANHTVHAVMHAGWIPVGDGVYRGQLAVLVKPNGMAGAVYLAAIRPFRNLIVYPRMMRDLARRWRAGAAGQAPDCCAAGACVRATPGGGELHEWRRRTGAGQRPPSLVFPSSSSRAISRWPECAAVSSITCRTIQRTFVICLVYSGSG